MKRSVEFVSQFTVCITALFGLGYFALGFIINHSALLKFLDSQFFVALVTLSTGFLAYLIYLRKKSDEKVQIARVLLLEVRTAEERIGQIREKIRSRDTNDLPSIFATKSWNKHSYLFISDFDQDELKLIGDFYNYAELVEDFVRRNNNFFWVTTEERAKVVQQKLVELIIHSKSSDNPVDLNSLKENLLDNFANDPYSYFPNKIVLEIGNYIEKINPIMVTSVGIKLKKLARMSKM